MRKLTKDNYEEYSLENNNNESIAINEANDDEDRPCYSVDYYKEQLTPYESKLFETIEEALEEANKFDGELINRN